MKRSRSLRLRTPMVMIVCGTGLTVGVGLGQGWVAAIPVAVVVVAAAIGYYIVGGRDTDAGAMIGSRADERQNELRTRAQALAGVAGIVTALIGTMVAAALKDPTWPFALFAGVESVTFVAGLAIYSARSTR
jgi:MFS family permease